MQNQVGNSDNVGKTGNSGKEGMGKPDNHKVSRSTFILVVAIIVIVAMAAFAIYYLRTSSDITNNNNKISLLEGQVSSSQNQISSLQGQVSAYQSQITSLEAQISVYQPQITSLQGQLSLYQAQVSSLEGQVSSDGLQISNLQSQNNELQSIVNLSKSSIKTNPITITQPAGATSLVVTFVADYAGYLVVSGTSTTTSGYIQVTDSYSGYPYNSYTHYFGTSGTVLVPILPGTVGVYFGNSNIYGTVTTTLTVTYYY